MLVRWSKLKKLVEANFVDSMRHRVCLYSTRYGNCSCGHAWIMFDRKKIANFCTVAYFNFYRFRSTPENWKNFKSTQVYLKRNLKYKNYLCDYGEINRQDFYKSCWEYIHVLDIKSALSSGNIILEALAILDKKIGKNKLMRIDPNQLHSLAAFLLTERKKAEAKNKEQI